MSPGQENTVAMARLCAALGVESRIRILQLLRERALCVNALAARLGMTAAAVSQHLRVLRDAGLVRGERRGYFVHYTVGDNAGRRLDGVRRSLFPQRSVRVGRSGAEEGQRQRGKKQREKGR